MTNINNVDIIYLSTSVADCKEVVQCTDETLMPMRVFFVCKTEILENVHNDGKCYCAILSNKKAQQMLG